MITSVWLICVFACESFTAAKPLTNTEEYPEWEKSGESNEDLIGDMKLTKSQKIETGILPPNGRVRVTRKATNGHLWIRGVVPYEIHSSLSSHSAATTAIQEAMNLWSKNTDSCITFVPRTNETDYITFKSHKGCWSSVGRIGGQQFVSLTNAGGNSPHCWFTYVAAHEIGHALGFYHEQSRPDRDGYVTIHPENVLAGKKLNFKKYTSDVINTHGLPYNYQSIMHYTRNAFSSNGLATVTPVAAHAKEILGNTVRPNDLDYNQMKLLYHCSGSTSGVTAPPPSSCKDDYSSCPYWAHIDECTKNPIWMKKNCKKSCKQCPGGKSYCADDRHRCFWWMTQGYCQTNPNFMLAYCKASCKYGGCP